MRSTASQPGSPGLGPRLRDERQDDDGRNGRRDPPATDQARAQQFRRESRQRSRLHPASLPWRRARALRGGRGGVLGARAQASPQGAPALQPVQGSARPLRRARARRCALARGRDRAARSPTRRQRRRSAGRGSGTRPRRVADLRPRRPAPRPPRAAACGRLEVLPTLRHALRLRRRLPRAPGRLPMPNCGHARPPLDVVGREIELHGLDGSSFTLASPAGTARVELALPGLYNVYNALAAGSLATALGVPWTRSSPGWAASRRRSGDSNGSRSAIAGC